VGNNKPSHDRLKHLTREELFRMKVRGDNESSVKERDGAPLSLTGASILVCPDLKIVGEGLGI